MVVIVFFHCIFFEHFQSGTSSGAFWFLFSEFSSFSFSFRQRAYLDSHFSKATTSFGCKITKHKRNAFITEVDFNAKSAARENLEKARENLETLRTTAAQRKQSFNTVG